MIESEIYDHDIVIKKLTLNNFRGFDHLEIDFDDKLTVLIGENGSGKTTILDGVAKFLRYLLSSIFENKRSGSEFVTEYDIKNGQEKFENTLITSLSFFQYTEIDEGVSRKYTELRKNKDGIEVEVTINKYEDGEEPKSDWEIIHRDFEVGVEFARGNKDYTFFSNTQEATNFGYSIFQLSESGENIQFPIIVYYPCDSMIITEAKNEQPLIKSNLNNRYSIYDNALSGNSLDFKNFFEWFKWQENKELSKKTRNPILETVRQAIYQVLNDEVNDNYPEKYLYTEWETNINGELMLWKNGSYLQINQLSSGEKKLMLLVADISRRIATANPYLDNPLHGTGIVIIDEIDTHLHPKWQRKVIPKLREIFPNVQFVVTTHSPLVLGEVESKCIRILDDGKVYGAEDTYGHDVNSILNMIMKTPESRFAQEIETIEEMISESKINEAKEKLERLKKEIEGTSISLVKLDSLIRKKEILIK